MASAVTGFLNHALAANAVNGAKPMDGSTGSKGDSTTSDPNSAGITANDFLTLLVTELKNQDPTANTDPNAYINQLVGVNSLQQLIKINETLTPGLSSTAESSGNRVSGRSTYGLAADPRVDGANGDTVAASSAAAQSHGSGIRSVFGNLGVPEASPAANRAAQSLSGHR